MRYWVRIPRWHQNGPCKLPHANGYPASRCSVRASTRWTSSACDVVVFEVSLPYEQNWHRFLEFQTILDGRRVPVVLTTTNKRALADLIGALQPIETASG